MSRETTNLTYDLTDLNRRYLACFVAAVTGESRDDAERYIEELSHDEALAHHIAQATLESPQAEVADPQARYGRRLGWYAIVRITKPSLVVETGVDKGLGACVIAAALQRNDSEGRGGRYVGIDINPAAGELLGPPYSEFGNLITGDAVATLGSLEGPVDVYISDSDHSPSYEAREYEAVAALLSSDGFVIADNAHTNPALLDFAERTQRAFLFFAEEPKGHWYPGAGIGVAYPSRSVRMSQ